LRFLANFAVAGNEVVVVLAARLGRSAGGWDAQELARRLTAAGLEVESVAPPRRPSAASWWRASSAASAIRRPTS